MDATAFKEDSPSAMQAATTVNAAEMGLISGESHMSHFADEPVRRRQARLLQVEQPK